MTTPPSDPFETPGDNESARPPRYGDAPPPRPAVPGYPAAEQQFGQPTGQPSDWPPPATVEPPSSILRAVKLMYAGAVLSFIWTLLVLPQRDAMRDRLDPEDFDMTENDLDALINTVIGSLVVIGLITVGLWVLMARTNRDGKSWARVVATVLGVLGILVGLVGLLQVNTVGLMLNLALIALSVWILVLLYRQESTEYYSAVSSRF